MVFGEADGGGMALLFTAMHPQRVSALILANTTARMVSAPDYPAGIAPEVADTMVEMAISSWGTPEAIQIEFPSRVHDREFVEWAARMWRASATPKSAAAQFRHSFEHFDAREALPLIQVPTLVLHNQNLFIPIAMGRYLAEGIDGAKFVEVSGADFFMATSDDAMAEIAEFLTGSRPSPEIDRILATVLFTDIVGSTEQAAALGDRRWRQLLESHESVNRSIVDSHRGRLVKMTGDGALATFEGPGRAIRCALALHDALDLLGIKIRAGLHTGEVELVGDDIGGIGVHIAARVMAAASPGDLLVSQAVPILVAGSGIEFEDRGEHELKGVPGSWQLFAVKR